MYSGLENHPNWHREARPRLAASILIAATLVAAFVLLTTFPADEEPLTELEVFLLEQQPPVEVEPESVVEEIVPPEPVVEEQVVEQTVEPERAIPEPAQPTKDWYAQMDSVIESVTAEREKTYAINPVQDALRREAAVKFRASRAPVEKPIWENVEVDQMGRKILVSGDCHRVIDDPSAVRNYDFRTFHQFIVYCAKYDPPPRELPWVEEIRERHVYLQPEDTQGDDRSEFLAELQ